MIFCERCLNKLCCYIFLGSFAISQQSLTFVFDVLGTPTVERIHRMFKVHSLCHIEEHCTVWSDVPLEAVNWCTKECYCGREARRRRRPTTRALFRRALQHRWAEIRQVDSRLI